MPASSNFDWPNTLEFGHLKKIRLNPKPKILRYKLVCLLLLKDKSIWTDHLFDIMKILEREEERNATYGEFGKTAR